MHACAVSFQIGEFPGICSASDLVSSQLNDRLMTLIRVVLAVCRLPQAETAHAPPSARLWLGNISNQVTAPIVRAAFEGFGTVVDAAAFPARIGPLGYAIVVFDRVRAPPGAADVV